MAGAFQSNFVQQNAFQTITIYQLSLSDGLNLGDTPSIIAILGITDGLTLGDALANIASLQITDGVQFGDNEVLLTTMYLSLLDGITLGDLVTLGGIDFTSLILQLYGRSLTTRLRDRSFTMKLYDRHLNVNIGGIHE